MKGNIRFIFLVLLIFSVSHVYSATTIQARKAQFAGESSYFVPNNPNGIRLSVSEVMGAVLEEDINIVGSGDDGVTRILDITSLNLSSGEVPKSRMEIIVPEEMGRIPEEFDTSYRVVGRYKESLEFNGHGAVGTLSQEDFINITVVEIYSPDGDQTALNLEKLGMIELQRENIDRKIQTEALSTIDFIISFFCGALLLATFISWLSSLSNAISDGRKELETLTSWGLSRNEVVLAFLSLRKEVFGSTLLESGILYVAAWVFSRFILGASGTSIFALSWLSGWALIALSLYTYLWLSSYRRAVPGFKLRSDLSWFLIGLVGFFMVLAEARRLLFLTLALVVLIHLVKRLQLTSRALFASVGGVSVAMFVLVVVMVIVNSTIVSLWATSLERQENVVAATMPFETTVIIEDDQWDDRFVAGYQKFHYINSIDGVILGEKRAFPLIVSTDLERYLSFVRDGGPIAADSVLIGATLAFKNGVAVGDNMYIGSRLVQVTHILDSYQHAGMVVYLSDDTFTEIFGSSGTVILQTDARAEDLPPLPNFETRIQTREQFLEFYQNSVSEVLYLTLSLSAVVFCLTAIVFYKLLLIYFNSVLWKLNLLRGYGIRALEFSFYSVYQITSIAIVALFASSIVGNRIGEGISRGILAASDAYIPITVSYQSATLTLVEVVGFSVIISFHLYRKLSKESIYSQYVNLIARV